LSDKNDRTQQRQKKQGQRIGTSALVAAASLLGTTLGVAATTQAEPARLPAQGSVDRNAGSAEHKTLVAIYLKSATTTPQVKTPASRQLKLRPSSSQIKLQGTKQGKLKGE